MTTRLARVGRGGVLAVLVVVAVAGCGGGGSSGGNSGAAGKALFVQTGCGACHTLKAAGTTGTIGPDLDARKPGKSVVETFVRRGSAQMPAFENRLSNQQIDALADYVSSAVASDASGS